jgi:metallo-beta-lactamase class B
LDSGFDETVPLIAKNMKQLGFKIEDVKILINSHAHFDHAGGFAELKRLTGAKLMISAGDAKLIETGGKSDFQWGDNPSFHFKPASVDRVLNDNDLIELGGVTMTARITPGHTKGCTTWTMQVQEAGRPLEVVFIGSTTVPGSKLVNNPNYPNIAADYAHTFALLRSFKCDVFLGPHGSFFSLDEKWTRLERGRKQNPFIDPEGYRQFIDRTEAAYLKQLKAEQDN